MNTEVIYLSKHEMVIDKNDYECMVKELKQLRKLKKIIPNIHKLNDIAYRIATSAITTRTMTEKQWNRCNTDNVLWEPLDKYGPEFTEDLVNEIASNVLRQLRFICEANY